MYKIGTYITDPVGNNEFHYDERLALGSQCKIFVPSLITGSIDDLEEGSEIVFEEVEFTESRTGYGMNEGKLVSCTGLKHFIQTTYKNIPTYIFDNHNHALTFRTKELMAPLIKGEVSADADGGFEKAKKHLSVIHIDQHTDIKPNTNQLPITNYELPITEVEDFVNTQTNVGNFISAALNNGIIDEVIQIRTDYALYNLLPETCSLKPFILDIDIDFRVDKEVTPQDIKIIRTLMQQAKLVTIATSPYFMNQKKAIEIVKQLLK